MSGQHLQAGSAGVQRVLVVGGGRWARVIVGVLSSVAEPAIEIVVQSTRGYSAMTEWAERTALSSRVCVSSTPLDQMPLSVGRTAVIVANAAADHERAAAWSLSRGFHTLVEKPIAPSASAGLRLRDLSDRQGGRLAATQVSLFARYLETFVTMTGAVAPLETLNIEWADPVNEERHHELKTYDASLTVFADVLPHVVSLASAVFGRLPRGCRLEDVTRGGARCVLELDYGGATCRTVVERRAPARRRSISVEARGAPLTLDFAREPGTIGSGGVMINGDPDWGALPHPVALMLMTFLRWASGGPADRRLDPGPGLLACEFTTDLWPAYAGRVLPWLSAEVACLNGQSDDLAYALNELLHQRDLEAHLRHA